MQIADTRNGIRHRINLKGISSPYVFPHGAVLVRSLSIGDNDDCAIPLLFQKYIFTQPTAAGNRQMENV